ncbi:MAG TPA: DUF29 domain-containing protein [Caulobacteraceae bacterium]|nr:DUF29 domain-containing protein [Caulobacteraceae bacterium]
MSATYESDVVAWANEQAALLRAGNFSALDIEHIADEVDDVGKSEKRELASRMAVLIAHLLKWRAQGASRGANWEVTIKIQRRAVATHLKDAPSLKATLRDDRWFSSVWGDAVDHAMKETGVADFPEACPWPMDQILDPNFLPG